MGPRQATDRNVRKNPYSFIGAGAVLGIFCGRQTWRAENNRVRPAVENVTFLSGTARHTVPVRVRPFLLSIRRQFSGPAIISWMAANPMPALRPNHRWMARRYCESSATAGWNRLEKLI